MLIDCQRAALLRNALRTVAILRGKLHSGVHVVHLQRKMHGTGVVRPAIVASGRRHAVVLQKFYSLTRDFDHRNIRLRIDGTGNVGECRAAGLAGSLDFGSQPVDPERQRVL